MNIDTSALYFNLIYHTMLQCSYYDYFPISTNKFAFSEWVLVHEEVFKVSHPAAVGKIACIGLKQQHRTVNKSSL